VTVRDVADQWLADAGAGLVRNRSGDPYKPSALRGYEQALRTHLLPSIGGARLDDVRRPDLQALADQLLRDGLSPSTVRNALMPMRAICRRAHARGEIADNPTRGLELPAVRGRRDRIAEPQEAAALLAALGGKDRPRWATAFYAGLPRDELQALRWSDLDTARGVIQVRRSWDRVAGEIEPKTEAGRRVVPIPRALAAHLAPTANSVPDALVFGRSSNRPFESGTVTDRARRAWNAAGLRAITCTNAATPTPASLRVPMRDARSACPPV